MSINILSLYFSDFFLVLRAYKGLIFLDFSLFKSLKGLIFHVNHLPADDSLKISSLFISKLKKILDLSSAANLIGALLVNIKVTTSSWFIILNTMQISFWSLNNVCLIYYINMIMILKLMPFSREKCLFYQDNFFSLLNFNQNHRTMFS